MDVSDYAFGCNLRVGAYKLIGILWYVQNVMNPAVFILALPLLRLNAWKSWKVICSTLYCKMVDRKIYSARDSIRTAIGTSVQLQRTAF